MARILQFVNVFIKYIHHFNCLSHDIEHRRGQRQGRPGLPGRPRVRSAEDICVTIRDDCECFRIQVDDYTGIVTVVDNMPMFELFEKSC